MMFLSVMAGPDPAIDRRTVLVVMAGRSLAMAWNQTAALTYLSGQSL
jgi:hypothetical protein